MRRNDFNQLIKKDVSELRTQLETLHKEIANLRLEMVMRKVKNVSLLGQKKRDIAQILTVLKEREKQNG